MSIFSDIGSGVGDFFSGVKTYAAAAMIILILLLAGGFYIYFNYAQNKIQVVEGDNARLQDSFNTEKNSFEAQQKAYNDLLGKLTAEQTRNNKIAKQNSDLKNKLSSYDYLNNAKTNSTTTETDVNTQFNQIIQTMEKDSDPTQYDLKATTTGAPTK